MRSNAARILTPTSYASDAQRVALWVVPSAGASDDTPAQISFTDQSGVAISTVIVSAAVTLTDFDSGTAEATGGEIDVNGDANWQTSRAVVDGDQIRARHTSSASYLTAINTVVTIGGVSDTFTSTTASAYPSVASVRRFRVGARRIVRLR